MPTNYLLTAYGQPHALGYLATKDGQYPTNPVTIIGLLDTAVELGLAGVEIPITPHTGVSQPLPIAQLKEELIARNLAIVPDYMALVQADPVAFRQFLEDASFLGATVVRSLCSLLLCGDRRKLETPWDEVMQVVAVRLREALPIAEDLGLSIAVENHQDATSADLIRLYEMTGESSAYGICLDTGNPLAVGEGPVEFAQRIAPLIRHLHLKDYTIHFAETGYHLVRCPAGDGVVDFPKVLEIAQSNGFPLQPGIEGAAQPTRTIPLLEDGWWAGYPIEQACYLPEALRVLWAKGIPATQPYGSPWEHGADSATVLAYEWDELHRSVAYLKALNQR
jgi:sugar phosphate isomerase/epimerase